MGIGSRLVVMRATDQPVGVEHQSTSPIQAWSGQRGWVWVQGISPEGLSEVLKNVFWALLWMYLRWIASKKLLHSTGNSAQCYAAAWMGGVSLEQEYMDTYDWVPLLSTWNSKYCELAILQNKSKKKKILWGCRRRTSILCRENVGQDSEGKKQCEEDYGTLLFFSKQLYWSMADLQCCLHFCCTANWLSYTHTKIYFLFLFLFITVL